MKALVEVVRRTVIPSDDFLGRLVRIRADHRTGELVIQISEGGIRRVEFIEREPLQIAESA